MIRHHVRNRHEQRIIYRVGTPCFDLIISNKRDRNDDFNVSGVCLVVHTTKENIAMKDGSFTRSDQKKERIPADDDDWWNTTTTMVRDKRQFWTKQTDSFIWALRISLLRWSVVQWRWSHLDTARWTKVIRDAENRQTVDNQTTKTLWQSKWLTKWGVSTMAGWNETIERIDGDSG